MGGQASGDDRRLVVAATQLPKQVQRHGNDNVDLIEHTTDSRPLDQALGEPLADRPPALVFELMDEVFERVVEDAKSEDSVVVGNAVTLAKWARPIHLRNRRAAFLTRRGRLQLNKPVET